jgi:hypothetical protein
MRCGVISYMFWLCYMMLAVRAVGQKAAKSGSRRSFSSSPHTTPHAGPHEAVQSVVKCDPSET